MNQQNAEAMKRATLRQRVLILMGNNAWYSLAEIVKACGGSEAGVSARIRDFRKAPLHRAVERRRRGKGTLYEYRLIPKLGAGQMGMFE